MNKYSRDVWKQIHLTRLKTKFKPLLLLKIVVVLTCSLVRFFPVLIVTSWPLKRQGYHVAPSRSFKSPLFHKSLRNIFPIRSTCQFQHKLPHVVTCEMGNSSVRNNLVPTHHAPYFIKLGPKFACPVCVHLAFDLWLKCTLTDKTFKAVIKARVLWNRANIIHATHVLKWNKIYYIVLCFCPSRSFHAYCCSPCFILQSYLNPFHVYFRPFYSFITFQYVYHFFSLFAGLQSVFIRAVYLD